MKLIYFSNPFDITLILGMNLPRFCIIKLESYFFRLLNMTIILLFNLGFTLQSLHIKPLYFPVIWQ